MYAVADRRSYGVSLEGRFGQAYNEDAFRYFLEIERKRAARARRPVLLLLLDVRERPAAGPRIDPAQAARLFSVLWLCLRESDVVGWFREDRTVGAVLTQVGDGLRPEMTRAIRERIGQALSRDLSAEVARRLRVRLYQLRGGLRG
jgi:hypothetical protein